jgi:glycosyltransferase involved in cell wall biosynthesis
MLSAMASSGALPELAFALCFEGRLSSELREAGAPVLPLPQVRVRHPLSIRRYRRTLLTELARTRPQAVLCHGIWSYCMAAPAVRRAGLSPVLFLHDVPEPSKLLYRWAWLRPPSLIVANSEFVRRSVVGLGKQVPTAVVHPLVLAAMAPSPREVSELRRSYAVQDDDVVLLQASRLDAWKGHRALLDALVRLKDRPRWRTWIAGSPQRSEEREYFAELQLRAGRLGIADRVTFIGHRSDMPLVLSACDIYCQPNEQPEPFGMVFVEAMAMGKPIVARRAGGVLEIAAEGCGILCDAGDAPVADAIDALLRDSELRQRMGIEARRQAASLCGAETFAVRLHAALALR